MRKAQWFLVFGMRILYVKDLHMMAREYGILKVASGRLILGRMVLGGPASNHEEAGASP